MALHPKGTDLTRTYTPEEFEKLSEFNNGYELVT